MGVSARDNKDGDGVAVEVSVGIFRGSAVFVSVKWMAVEVAGSTGCVGLMTGVGTEPLQDASISAAVRKNILMYLKMFMYHLPLMFRDYNVCLFAFIRNCSLKSSLLWVFTTECRTSVAHCKAAAWIII